MVFMVIMVYDFYFIVFIKGGYLKYYFSGVCKYWLLINLVCIFVLNRFVVLLFYEIYFKWLINKVLY